MKIIGKNSFLYWLRIPFAIYVIGFIASSLWIFGLMLNYQLHNNYNRFTSISNWNNSNTEIVQFKYPFTKMCLATENSTEGLLLAFLGLLSFSFVLFFALRIVLKLSRDKIFSENIVLDFKFLGYGLISFGIVHILVDFATSSNQFDTTPPFFYIVTGLVLIFIKEIFAKAQKIQEENDLTI